ncbi:hypothetical protein EV14_2258 [Prochlorococcus sp. MIT 0703]|nr:hypothetical protein EV12_1570 [Prochlorococcus sp. MIT 0701]KGG31466.1 hypothetical protein EV14_2258 [Prochlorococcus sp. MIT 0703]
MQKFLDILLMKLLSLTYIDCRNRSHKFSYDFAWLLVFKGA